jgi:hypothetical protein
MGLDMYLTRKVYVGTNFEHNRKEGDKCILNGVEYDINSLTDLCFEVAYWRKANHIHEWFVQNVQSGQDDCGSYYVSTEQLRELIEICQNSLDYLSTLKYETDDSGFKTFKGVDESKLLPTVQGFFFGSTDYDEYYEEQLNYTISTLKNAVQKDFGDFFIKVVGNHLKL